MILSKDTLRHAGCNVAGPYFDTDRINLERVSALPAKAERSRSLTPAVTASGTGALHLTYNLDIRHPDFLFEAMKKDGYHGNTIGVGVKWSNQDSGIRGAGILGTIDRKGTAGPVEFTGTVPLPLNDLGGKIQADLVFYGEGSRISCPTEFISGSLVTTLRSDQLEIPYRSDRLVTYRTQGTDHGISPGYGNIFQLREDGPSIPVEIIRSAVYPLWQLNYRGCDPFNEPLDGTLLKLQLNAGHPDYPQLTGPQCSAALIREVRASLLGSIVETVSQRVPYLNLQKQPVLPDAVRTVGELVRWIIETYNLDNVRTSAELAAQLRNPAYSGPAAGEVLWPKLSKEEAADRCRAWQSASYESMLTQMTDYADASTHLSWIRKYLRMYAENLFHEMSWDTSSLKGAYRFDLEFGLELHRVFAEAGFSARLGARNGVWRALAVNILPDVVAKRIRGFSANRFYSEGRRNYLRTVWWYIHLSLQFDTAGLPDYNTTYNILARNSTDTIMQIVDRSGNGGYPLELYREIMRQHAEWTEGTDVERNMLRRLLEKNVRLTHRIEPVFYKGSVRKYVYDLFGEILPA